MKRLIFLIALLPTLLWGQQNSKLAQNLLLSVQSGANALSGTAITSGTPTSGVTYQMGNVGGSSDLSACGAPTTADGVIFKADGDAPAEWDGAILRPIHSSALTLPNPSYTLTNSGAIPTYGHKGNASYYSFDGVDDKLQVSATDYSWVGDMTFVIRIKVNDITTTQCVITNSDGVNNRVFLAISGGMIGVTSTYGNLSSDVTTGDHTIVIKKASGVLTMTLDGVNSTGTASLISMSYGSYCVLGSNDVNYFNGGIYSFMVFNYALSASDVAYYSNPANHLRAVDQGATGAELVTNGDFASDVSGWSALANTTITHEPTAIGGISNTAKMVYTGSGNHVMYQAENLTIGKSYNYSIKVYGPVSSLLFRAYDGSWTSDLIGTLAISSADTWTTFSGKWTATQTSEKFGIQNDAITGTWYIDDVSIKQAGATLSLTPEGMLGQSLWRDYYHSTDIAVGTGSTAPRLVKDWAGMNAWRFTGDDLLSNSSLTTGLPTGTGDRTVIMWVNQSVATTFATVFLYGTLENDKTFLYSFDGTTRKMILGKYGGNASSASTTAMPLDEWHQIAITFSSGNIKYYYDGVLDGTATISGMNTTLARLDIGGVYGIGQYFTGIIELPKIYGKVLSDEEIALSYSVYE